MPLSPQDVAAKQFTVVRLTQGYKMDEVDAFLDEVEGELGRLRGDTEDPRPSRGRPAAPAAPAPAPVPVQAPPPPAPPVMPPPAVAAPAPPPTDAAVKMLELAQRTADD